MTSPSLVEIKIFGQIRLPGKILIKKDVITTTIANFYTRIFRTQKLHSKQRTMLSKEEGDTATSEMEHDS